MFANLKTSIAYKTIDPVLRLFPAKKRFTFWKVFWVMLGIYVLFLVVAILVVYTFPNAKQPPDWRMFLDLISSISMVVGLFFHTLFFYVALNHFYYLIAERKSLFFFLLSSLVLTGVTYGYVMLEGAIRPDMKEGYWSGGIAVVFFFICFLLSAAPSLLIAFIANLGDEKKERKVLEAQKMQLEVEKTHANLNFLKAQINPHFLHNTLNFLYAKSLPYSPELSEGILTLSDIMRYALSDGNGKNGKAALQDEIEHLRNVIRIHQLRYNNNLQVNFEVNGIVNGVSIIPFVLITIAENAFKHGDLKSKEYPIDIRLTIDNKGLYFYCRNKKKTGPKELSTGIGLDNIKKRLDFAYKDQYKLDIKDEHELYTTQLTIHSL